MVLNRHLLSLGARIFYYLSGGQSIDLDAVMNSSVKQSHPKNFGEKSVWIVIKSNNIKEVLSFLNIKKIDKVPWEDGFIKNNKENGIFITGPINGWILLTGSGVLEPDYNEGMKKINSYLDKISNVYGEAQYFLSQRTTFTAIWSKSLKGKIERTYAIGDNFFYQEGFTSRLEKNMALITDNPYLAENKHLFGQYAYPDVDNILKIAENWSFNPSKISDMPDVKGFGFLVETNI